MNRTLFFGEGIFETILWRGETPKFRLHYERLKKSAETLGLPYPSYEEFLRSVEERTGGLRNLYVKVVVLYGGPDRFWESPEGYTLEVIVKNLPEVPESVNLTVSPYRRHSKDPLCRHKTTSYLFNVLVRREARSRGFYEALILNEREEITECSAANILVLKKDRLMAPSRDSGLLWGTTIEVVARTLGVEEERITLGDLLSADSLFLTNSLVGVVGVSRLEGRDLPIDREVLKDLKKAIDSFNPLQET